MALEIKTLEKVSISHEEFQYQRALYFFLTGDYFTSADLSNNLLNRDLKDKERVLLLLRLSDIKLLHTRDYPPFASQLSSRETPYLLSLLDATYKMWAFEESILLSRVLDKEGAARYFEGISLMRLNRLGEAVLKLDQVPSGDKFYPYARIALAQIEVMKHNMGKAEGYLKKLLSYPILNETGMTDKVRITHSQILFEKGLNQEALRGFQKVSFGSPLYKEALTGQAWSLIMSGDYDTARSLLETMAFNPPYSSIDQEAQVLLGYCYIKLFMAETSIEYFQRLLEKYYNSEKRLEQMIEDKDLRNRYLSILLAKDDKPLSKEEQFYLSPLLNDQDLSDLLKIYEMLSLLKSDFKKKEREIVEKERYLENAIRGINELLPIIDKKIHRVKDIVAKTERKTERREKELSGYLQGNEAFFQGIETRILERWEKELQRKVHNDAKRLIRVVLREWSVTRLMERCSGSVVICHIANHLSMISSDESSEVIRDVANVIEMMGKDFSNIEDGAKLKFEKVFYVLRIDALERLKGLEWVLKELKSTREETKKNIDFIEELTGHTLTELDTQIKERFLKIKYELGDFRSDIVAGLGEARIYQGKGNQE